MIPRLPVDAGDGDVHRLLAAALMASLAFPARRIFLGAASSALDRLEHVVAAAEVDADQNLAEVTAAGTASHAVLVQLAEALLRARRERDSIRVLRATIAQVARELDRLDPKGAKAA